MLVATRPRTRNSLKARDPERTRRRLLEAGFREVYERGFQSADLDAVLDRAGVTKGALYYHFVIAVYEGYISLAKNSQDPRLLKSGKKRMISYIESLRDSFLCSSTYQLVGMCGLN
jgi:tetracycline repressor-like protein